MILNKKTALIIGAGGCLGQAIAKAYARAGAALIVADLNHQAAVQTLKAVGKRIGGVALQVDVSDTTASSQLVDNVIDRFGRLDILVNCAAICLVDALLELTPERWDSVFVVNARGAFFCMQAAAKVMIPQKFGRIINVSTPASRMAFPNFASYAASKAALDSDLPPRTSPPSKLDLEPLTWPGKLYQA